MNSEAYNKFVSSFNDTYEVIVSEEELNVRMKEFNTWFITLDKAMRLQVANEVTPLITKAAEQIHYKQCTLEEMILVNDGRMKANSYYGKY
ncbi:MULTISPECIES: flagellar biosynthesis protein FlgG [unclassified Bacillus (in: firmicutes)]|uniref:flagellar biosynthesis protein FlgG n=1 Tax=unclassified Bacillus (in: firmicutes) TaxID=185979 RepID=UPI00232D9113|nr:flagellar biosynthesis protein FlgG [Bacillus sp. BP-3]MDC2865751.1 flagellar biosynthesis protein FlgG [Bacillus sp. BP-3]